MRHSEQINELATALAKFHTTAPHIDLDGKANVGSYGYKYATLPQILSKVRPILSECGLSVLQLVGEGGSVETILTHTSGQWIASDPVRLPSKDNSPQGYGSAISYAKRYSLSAILALAAEEDDDGATAQREHGNRSRSNGSTSNGSTSKAATDGTISEAQAKRFHAIATTNKWTKSEVDLMLADAGLSSSKEITRSRYDAAVGALSDEDRHAKIAARIAEGEGVPA